MRKISRKNITFLLRSIPLIFLAPIFRIRAGARLPGKEFDLYGRKISFRFLKRGYLKRFVACFCTPVSIVRYFEFSFVLNAVNWPDVETWLDVSSPRLFLLFLLNKHHRVQGETINPDFRDLHETRAYLDILDLSERTHLAAYDATTLPYPDSSFDAITSISVLEHIPEEKDSLAMRELWRVLKPGGTLVITIPCTREHRDEWREKDEYGLGSPEKGEQYFFQRFYDAKTIQTRLGDSIGRKPERMDVFGEKRNGTFTQYEKRWMELGMKETIQDPLHLVRDYQHFSTINDLPGIGVCGLVFRKQQM